MRVAGQRARPRLLPGLLGRVRRELRQQGTHQDHHARRGGDGHHRQARPAGRHVAGHGGHGDGHGGDEQFRRRAAPGADHATVVPALLGRSHGAASACLGLGGGERGSQFVEGLLGRVALAAAQRMAGEPGLVEQLGQPRGRGPAHQAAAGRPGQQLVGRVGHGPGRAPLGQAVLHRHVAGDDGRPGVVHGAQRRPARFHRLPQVLGVLGDEVAVPAAERRPPNRRDHQMLSTTAATSATMSRTYRITASGKWKAGCAGR